ncbi:MAG: translation initiation factor IF-2 [Desulfovibrio sp.]|nr:translation initiation factor IF-2 [Desulfovibrio sp.]
MTIFEWAAIGGIVLALFIFCARVMRRGLTTLDETRSQHLEKIAEGERQLAEDRRKITAEEQFHLLEAAIADLIRLSPYPEAWQIGLQHNIIYLETTGSRWEIELAMSERALRSSGRILHGKPHWLLRNEDIHEHYTDVAQLLASLNRHIRTAEEPEPLPRHLARRLAGTRSGAALMRSQDDMQKSWKE